MAFGFVNACQWTAVSSGTGDFVVSAATTGFKTMAGAGAVNGTTYRYRAESADRTEWEVGYGVYTSGSVTLARTTILLSSTGAKVSFTAAPTVGIVLAAEDVLSAANTIANLTALGNVSGAAAVPGAVTIREILTAARTYYVRTDGSDSNTGLVDSAGGAFLTIQKAIDVIVATLDTAGYALTVQVGAGTYAAGFTLSQRLIGCGSLTVTGDNTTPTNCVISMASGVCVTAQNYAIASIGGFKLVNTAGICLYANGYSTLSLSGKMEFGASGIHVYCITNSTINLLQDYTISGNAGQHWLLNTFATVNAYSRTITLTGTPAFATAFAQAENFSFIYCFSNTFSGSGTGPRYTSTTNSIINTASGSTTYLPGNAAHGAPTATGGQYA